MPTLKNCTVCGDQFPADRVTAKYCKEACKKKGQRKGGISAGLGTDAHPATASRVTPPKADLEGTLKDMPEMAVGDMDELTIRMNARLAAKGLPLIETGPEVYRFVPTGIAELDGLTQRLDVAKKGGLPRGRITEIYGPNRSGKSSLTKLICKNNPDLKVLFFDAEGGMIEPAANMRVVKANVVEEIGRAIVEAIQEDAYDLIVVDSVASLVTQKQFDDDPEGKASMARALNPEVKRIVAHLNSGRCRTAMLFINQLRSTTQAFGAMEYTVGGNALPYFASLRLEFRSSTADKMKKKINGKEMLVGQYVRCTVKKSRFGPIDDVVRYPMEYSVFKPFEEYYQERIKEILG